MKSLWVVRCAIALVGAIAAVSLGLGSPTLAMEPKESSKYFHEGKLVRIVVGFGPGGSFDIAARILARHMPKYIPGDPGVIVQNMPGAGTLLAATHVYTRPGDGLTIGALHGGMVNRHVTGVARGNFELERFIWLGQAGPAGTPRLFSVRPQVAASLDEFVEVQTKRQVFVASAGPGTGFHAFGKYLEVAGLNVKVISYKSGAEAWAAVEKGEVDAIAGTVETAIGNYRRYYDERVVVPIFFHGPRQELPPGFGVNAADIPTFEDLAKRVEFSDDLIALSNYLLDVYSLMRLYALPPETPPEIVKMFRNAFMKVWRDDPKAVAEGERLFGKAEPISGEELGAKIDGLAKTSSKIVQLYRKYFAAH